MHHLCQFLLLSSVVLLVHGTSISTKTVAIKSNLRERGTQFLRCSGMFSENNELNSLFPKAWEVPTVVAADRSFNVSFKYGQIACSASAVHELTLYFDEIEGKRTEEFVSVGYFRSGKELYHPNEFCISELTDTFVTVNVCNTTTCGPHNPCLPKCCPLHKLLTPYTDSTGNIRNKCGSPSDGAGAHFQPVLYESPFSRLGDVLPAHFHHRRPACQNQLILPHSSNEVAISYYKRPGLCYRIKPNGKLTYRDVHYNWIEVDPEDYCLDGFYYGPNGTGFTGDEGDYGVVMCAAPSETANTYSKVHSLIIGVTLLCSSVFLCLTSVTYVLLWRQHSTSGMTTICHSSSMFFMYVSIGSAHLSSVFPNSSFTASRACEALGISAHFLFLSSFSWLTVINFQLFRTFFRQQHPSRSKGVRGFWRYILFGYGAPAMIILLSVMMDQLYGSDPCNPYPVPAYGLHRKCYMDTAAMGPYMYYPVGCLLATNVVLFFITAYKLHECQKSTKLARENLDQSQQMLKVILRLFFVMGVTWIFEFISWLDSRDQSKWYWLALDIINCLQAIAVFVIYVCKPEIARSLMRNYPSFKPFLMAVLKCCRAKPVRRIDRTRPSTFTTSVRFSNKGSSVRSAMAKGQTSSLLRPGEHGVNSSKLLQI